MWVRARNIFKVIEEFIGKNYDLQVSNENLEQLMVILNNNQSRFVNILRNSSKNALHRTMLSKDGETVKLESGEVVKIDDGLRSEALIISDLFDCDEFDALELVLTGEVQVQHFPFLTRGLCAIVCYYDAHRFISAAVKSLAAFRIDENIPKPRELFEYLNLLLGDTAFVKRLIEILQTVSVQSELQSLHQPHVNGLGGPKHQEILRELIEETLENCAQTLYLICSSWRQEMVPPFLDDLFTPLKGLQPTAPFRSTHLSLWTAALILISPHNLQNMQCARNLLMAFHKEVMLEDWHDTCLQASLQFAVAVSYNWLSVHQLVQEVLGGFAIKEDDLLEKAIDGLTFQFIRKCIIAVPKFRENTMAFTMVDTLVKNFIAHFSNQLMLLQHAGEMELQHVEEMLERGQLHRPRLHFENFIRCIADLYDGDWKHLELLSAQFCSSESEELVKFLKNCRRLISPVLQVAFLDMLKSICKCRESAYFIFGLLSANRARFGDSTLCWDHFWKALHGYLGLFKQKKSRTSGIMQTAQSGQHDASQQIPQSELAGLVAWVQLVEVVARNDPVARHQFTDNSLWACVETAVSLVTSAIPLVLKGALFRFLASIALDERGAVKTWATLISFSVLNKTSSGKLIGIQGELETRECAMKCYDSSLGFLHLMKALFLHAANVDKRQLLLYLQFVVKSIICQFADRSYENVAQMWHLCSAACDTLYNFLRRYAVTAESVLNAEPQIIILTQILNDSPVFRALGAVLYDGAERLRDFSPRSADRETAALSVLRVLDTCVSLHSSLTDAVRATDSSIIIASLDSLFLTSVKSNPKATYITVIASYLTQPELFPEHSYHVISILRELCGCQPSLQTRLVQALSPFAVELIESCARLTSVKMTTIEASPLDAPVYHGIDELSLEKIRGESARLFIEMCSSSIESDPSVPNLAYLFCGFKISDLMNSIIESPGINCTAKTCLHSLVDLLVEMATSAAPFALPFSALFEPALRFMLRLVSVNAGCSNVVLRFFRSNYDLVYRLASSPLFLDTEERNNGDENMVLKNLKYTIQGLVLHLCAVELSSLLRNRHYSQPERYFRLMLSQREELMLEQGSTSEPTLVGQVALDYAPNEQRDEDEWPILWKLLKMGTDFDEMKIPPMELLNSKKLQNILSLCIRPTSTNIQQCDIEHLNWLLHRECNTISNEMQPEFSLGISQDAKQLLHYCTTYNLIKSSEASVRQLLSGWLSFVNILALFSPIPFLTFDVQYQYLSDALYLLLDYASEINMDAKLSAAISQCLLRLTASICALLKDLEENIAAFRAAITDVADVLIRFLIQPGKRSLQSKLDLYACISLILSCATESVVSEKEHKDISRSDDDFLFSLTVVKVAQQDLLRSAFTKYGHELISLLSKDICDSPPELRFVALSCLTQILREDTLGSQSLSIEFIRTGVLRYVLESIANASLSASEANDIRSLEYCNVVLTLITRLALTSCGWNGLNDVSVLKTLKSMPLWLNPPKDVFFATNPNLRTRSVRSLYMDYIANVVSLCIALCSNAHWKRVSLQVLELLSCNAEVLNHLVRTDKQNPFIVNCGILVAHIYQFDSSAGSHIEKSNCLNSLRELSGDFPPFSSSPSRAAFNTPRNLFNTSVPITH